MRGKKIIRKSVTDKLYVAIAISDINRNPLNICYKIFTQQKSNYVIVPPLLIRLTTEGENIK